MADYVYVRVLDSDGHYNIDNNERVDGGGLQIHLATEICTALPGKIFILHSVGTVCTVTFDVALSGPDQTTLNTVVSDHKANV